MSDMEDKMIHKWEGECPQELIDKWNRSELSQLSGWQPIETAPRDGTWILGGEFDEDSEWSYKSEMMVVSYRAPYGDRHPAEWHSHYEPYSLDPTHWMPLPKRP